MNSFPVIELKAEGVSLRFRNWVRKFGVTRLARSLGSNPRSVRRYLSDDHSISPGDARTIIALSRLEPLGGRPLDFMDIYGDTNPGRVRHVASGRQEWDS